MTFASYSSSLCVKGKAARAAIQFFPNDLADTDQINASLLMVTSGSLLRISPVIITVVLPHYTSL